MRKILPLLIALIGIAGGVGAGYALRPGGDSMKAHSSGHSSGEHHSSESTKDDAHDTHSDDGHGKDSHDSDGHGNQHAKSKNDAHHDDHGDDGHGSDSHGGGKQYVKLNNQFVVPVIKHERVTSLVVMSLSVEVNSGDNEAVYSIEPKLRDAFLQVMFDHANVGGFDGHFTSAKTMGILRKMLKDAAYHASGPLVTDVLVTELARQDM